MSLFRKHALSNCKTESDIINLSAIRVNIRKDMREARTNILAEYPCISKGDADNIILKSIDQEDILINLFCNALRSPIRRDTDFSATVEKFKEYIHNAIKACGYNKAVEQSTANKPIQTETPVEPKTETPTEPKTETPTEPKTETPTEPKTETPTEPKTETPTEPKNSIDNFIDEFNSEATKNTIRNIMNKYNIHFISLGLNEFNKFIEDMKAHVFMPMVKKYLGDNPNKDDLDDLLAEFYHNFATDKFHNNTMIDQIMDIARANNIQPNISINNMGEISVEFPNGKFIVKPEVKNNNDKMIVDRRGKIILFDYNTMNPYFIPLKIRENNKNILNRKAIEDIFTKTPFGVIQEIANNTAPAYLHDMYDEKIKSLIQIFDFSSIPTNFNSEMKEQLADKLYKTLQIISNDVGQFTQPMKVISVVGNKITVLAKGTNGTYNYEYNLDNPAEETEAPVEPKTETPVEPKTETPVEPKTETPVEPKTETPEASTEPKAEPKAKPKKQPQKKKTDAVSTESDKTPNSDSVNSEVDKAS